ncbi:hypothetical protein LMG26841_04347 [Achromobacter dolens]|uniref:Glycosyltransferase subfamily 4-like N-terminal domain-containing protein n=1 Tax=Achromobacter dolens TaxID=1287738 RepID=A0A6S7E988_9BURK|nr:hypothetical protein LMG26841_04347 [Achromobacter dolens]
MLDKKTFVNLLLINHYAGSPHHGMEFRPFHLAESWIARGHNVRIVASSYSHVRQRQPVLTERTLLERVGTVEYLWLRNRPYQGNGFGRLINMLQFTSMLAARSKELAAWKPDVVIASSTYPYDIWPAARIARLAKAKLVHEVHDLWPLTPVQLGGHDRWHPMIYSMQLAEDYACKHADKVISILPGTEKYLRGRGLQPGKFAHVPNGFSPELEKQPLPVEANRQLEEFASRYKTLCAYVGGHGVANALDHLIAAASDPAVADIGFVLVGNGPLKPALIATAAKLKCRNVLFLDPIPKACVSTLLQRTDMAFIGLSPSPLYLYGTSPNKLFDYMLAGLPIVHSIDTPEYDLVKTANCGISVPAADSHAIAVAVSQIAAMPKEARMLIGQRGQAYVRANHTYPVLADQFIESLTSI